MLIDCDTCEARGLACGDCVVTVMLGMPQIVGAGIEVDIDEARAIAVLAESGLIPPLRLVTGESPHEADDGGDGPPSRAAPGHDRRAM